MVFAIGFLLAHGVDPTPLAWDEALAGLVKFTVTFIIIAALTYPILSPLLSNSNQEAVSPVLSPKQNEAVGWVAAAFLLILTLGWWLARASFVEVMTEVTLKPENHAHQQTEGGQIAMWGDFHVEVVRVESGEVRIFLRDAYDRDIAARFYEAEVMAVPLKSEAKKESEEMTGSQEGAYVETSAALNDSYRFLKIDREETAYKVKVITPGWTSSLRFEFDDSQGKRSLPIWCSVPSPRSR